MLKRYRRKAKTAYELLERVCAHIKANPRTYNQDRWFVDDKDYVQTICKIMGTRAPECGTLGCRAGWIVALHDTGPLQANIEDRAVAILGVSLWDYRIGTSSAIANDLNRLFSGQAVTGKPGLVKYAKEGVRGLREFMKTHEAYLKARSLEGV